MIQIAGVDFGQYQSVTDVFLEACAKHAQKPAYSCMGQTLSFEDVERLTANFASYLQKTSR
jgi:long-chain acyl-CoA synthetase